MLRPSNPIHNITTRTKTAFKSNFLDPRAINSGIPYNHYFLYERAFEYKFRNYHGSHVFIQQMENALFDLQYSVLRGVSPASFSTPFDLRCIQMSRTHIPHQALGHGARNGDPSTRADSLILNPRQLHIRIAKASYIPAQRVIPVYYEVVAEMTYALDLFARMWRENAWVPEFDFDMMLRTDGLIMFVGNLTATRGEREASGEHEEGIDMTIKGTGMA